MATFINNTSGASSGTAVGKDPDYTDGAPEELELIGGRHNLASGARRQDFTTYKRSWPLKFTGLTNTQWVTNIKAFLISGSQVYYQGPEMAAKVAVIWEKARANQFMAKGDSANAPHWNVTLTLLEQ